MEIGRPATSAVEKVTSLQIVSRKQSVIDKINAKKATVDVIDEKAGDQVLSMKDLEDL